MTNIIEFLILGFMLGLLVGVPSGMLLVFYTFKEMNKRTINKIYKKLNKYIKEDMWDERVEHQISENDE